MVESEDRAADDARSSPQFIIPSADSSPVDQHDLSINQVSGPTNFSISFDVSFDSLPDKRPFTLSSTVRKETLKKRLSFEESPVSEAPTRRSDYFSVQLSKLQLSDGFPASPTDRLTFSDYENSSVLSIDKENIPANGKIPEFMNSSVLSTKLECNRIVVYSSDKISSSPKLTRKSLRQSNFFDSRASMLGLTQGSLLSNGADFTLSEQSELSLSINDGEDPKGDIDAMISPGNIQFTSQNLNIMNSASRDISFSQSKLSDSVLSEKIVSDQKTSPRFNGDYYCPRTKNSISDSDDSFNIVRTKTKPQIIESSPDCSSCSELGVLRITPKKRYMYDSDDSNEDEDKDLSGFIVDDDVVLYDDDASVEEEEEEEEGSSSSSSSSDESEVSCSGGDFVDLDGEDVSTAYRDVVSGGKKLIRTPSQTTGFRDIPRGSDKPLKESSATVSPTFITPHKPFRTPSSIQPTSDRRKTRIAPPLSVKSKTGTPATPNPTFKRNIMKAARELFQSFNANVFYDKLPADLEIVLNKRLNTTAGRCVYLRKMSQYRVYVELSPKVVDCLERLKETLAHELCHAAAFIIDHKMDGHGPIWRKWAQRVNEKYPELPPVTRCHSYEISYKFNYKCNSETCSYKIGRHTKSIDLTRARCPYCMSTLYIEENSSKKAVPLNTWTDYVKRNFSRVKSSNPSSTPHKDIMKLLSSEFKSLGVTGATQERYHSEQQEHSQEQHFHAVETSIENQRII